MIEQFSAGSTASRAWIAAKQESRLSSLALVINSLARPVRAGGGRGHGAFPGGGIHAAGSGAYSAQRNPGLGQQILQFRDVTPCPHDSLVAGER